MIGIFDSGIGGLTVAREIARRLPDYDIVYFGDTARSPYGDKSRELIEKYTRADVEWLLSRGAKVIIAACHSSSVVAHDQVWEDITVPVLDMIAPTVEAALLKTKNGRIGIIGTRATINSQHYEKAINARSRVWPENKNQESKLKIPAFTRRWRSADQINYQVFSQAAPLLVPLVEEGWLNKPETKRIVKQYLRPLKQAQIDILILACTHYPWLKNIIAPRIGKKVRVIDPGRQVALALENYLRKNPSIDSEMKKTGQRNYYFSDISPHFIKVATKWLKHPVKLELAKL